MFIDFDDKSWMTKIYLASLRLEVETGLSLIFRSFRHFSVRLCSLNLK